MISFLGVTTVVLILIAVPMGYLLQRVATDETRAQLAQQADYFLDQVGLALAAGEDVDEAQLANLLPPDTSARLQLGRGDVIEVHDPPVGESISTTAAVDGMIVTVYASADPVRDRVQRPLIILAGLGAAGLLTTWLLAQAEARRLGRPLLELADTASRLGSGDFSVTAPRSGIPELDSLATTLDASAARIDALVRAERSFNSDASHQLRSALTGLRLRLEELALTDDPEAASEVAAAIQQADRLSTTIDDLLRLSRTGRAGVATRFGLRSFVANHVADAEVLLRRGRRRIIVEPGPELAIEAAQGAVGQALDVLLSNAVKHGSGDVRVRLDNHDGWAELIVADDGSIAPDLTADLFVQQPKLTAHGIGLPLARRIIEAEGGRLELIGTEPTRFRIRLPIPTPE